MKYKITNKLEQAVKCGNLLFLPKETRILDFKIASDRFHVEQINEEVEKPIKTNGGINNGKRTRHLE
jgi:hypothetical protein